MASGNARERCGHVEMPGRSVRHKTCPQEKLFCQSQSLTDPRDGKYPPSVILSHLSEEEGDQGSPVKFTANGCRLTNRLRLHITCMLPPYH